MKVGDKVVCINASSVLPGLTPPPLKRGDIYTVGGICYCPGCGVMNLDVGIHAENKNIQCQCGHLALTNGVWWAYASRFAPLEEKSDTMFEDIFQVVTNENRL